MQIRISHSLDEVPAADWDRLNPDGNPFLRHAFLAALEHHDCVGRTFGWLPHHLLARDEQGRLVGAVPLYFKTNSYGEFVFDWAWADASERAGMPWYPKAVTAVPYTPVTGRRLLIDPTLPDPEPVRRGLIEAAGELAREQGLSSLHWLFPDATDTDSLEKAGFLLRLGCQYHWTQPGYRDFDDFLDTFSAHKRKKLKRERRRVLEAGIEHRIVHGHEADEADWRTLHRFYQSTFDKKWGTATLNLPFFRELGATMGEQVVLIFAGIEGRPVAGALCFRSRSALYGRHWGCEADYHSLHFETCYYQGIDYCIREGLTLFEPGAQGEHKVSRGFLPTPTWSAHWIAQPRLRDAIADFLSREQRAMRDYIHTLNAEHLPYKADRLPPAARHVRRID